MATFREIVYMVHDQLKLSSDDSFYTEEHILFIINKMRAMLLARKYNASKNKPAQQIEDSNFQDISFALEQTTVYPHGCSALWLKTTEKVPSMMDMFTPKVFAVSDVVNELVTYIPAERMPYIGYNKWLGNIIYVAKGNDGYLYVRGNNPQFMYLQRLIVHGVVEDAVATAEASCECDEDGNKICDVLDKEFPMESSLVPLLIEYTVQELSGSRYAPQDKDNNAKDDMSDAAITGRPNTPAVKTSTGDE